MRKSEWAVKHFWCPFISKCLFDDNLFLMKPALYILPFFLLTLSGCDNLSEQKLVGKWKGAGITENSIPLDLNPKEIQFEFFESGLYTYQGTLNYKEAGSFKMTGDLLYTLDTINQASSEKAVKVKKLANDSLFLLMQSDGKERLVKLVREK